MLAQKKKLNSKALLVHRNYKTDYFYITIHMYLETMLAVFLQRLWIVLMASKGTQSLLSLPFWKACLVEGQTRVQVVGEIQIHEYKLTKQDNNQKVTCEQTDQQLLTSPVS